MIIFDPDLDHDECVETSEIFVEDLEETQRIDMTKIEDEKELEF
jgi:hypothetical protein